MQRRQFSQIAAAATTAGGASSSAATRAWVNTLFLATFSYGRGIAGRQVPDHGKQEYDTSFHGGNYAKIHPGFYRNTAMKSISHWKERRKPSWQPFRGGADGVLLSRKYSEMKLTNLRGAGEAVKELQLGWNCRLHL